MKNERLNSISRRNFIKVSAGVIATLTYDWRQFKAQAADGGSKSDFPVVVIGGGLGGLTAAAHLAHSGFPVTLVEQHDIPGGYATSFDRKRGRFSFEVSLHATSDANGALRRALEGAGVYGKVQTVELPELCRIVTPDYDLTWPQKNPEAIIKQLSNLFPDQATGIRGFFNEILGVLEHAMKPFDSDSWWDKIRFPITHKNMWKIRNDTLADLLDRHVSDPKLRSILSAYWGYYGLPPSKLSGFLYAIATADYVRHGAHYISNRSQELSDALMSSIEEAGGEVMLGTEATQIDVKNGAVTGVVIDEDTQLKARAVISNANVPATMKMATQNRGSDKIGTDLQEYLQKLKQFRPSLSSFVVWLGLSQEIKSKVKEYEIFINRGYDPEKAYQASLACDPEKADMLVTIYDNALEGYSVLGTSSVTIMMLSGYEPWKRFEKDYFAGRKKAYRKQKDHITQSLIRQVDASVLPGIREMIEVTEAATPLTNMRYTANPEGAIYGYEQTLENAFINRLKQKTPIKGLYLASAWTNPGGGFNPCLNSGANAFKHLLKDLPNL